jgi:hypothetical protein
MREKGIIKDIIKGSYIDKNNNLEYILMIDAKGMALKCVCFSKSHDNYPLNINTNIFFDINYDDVKNNKYKGKHYYIKGIKTEEGEKYNEQNSHSQASSPNNNVNSNQNYSTPQNVQAQTINPMDLYKSKAINASIKLFSLNSSLLKNESLSISHIKDLAQYLMDKYFSIYGGQSNPTVLINALNESIEISIQLNDYIAFQNKTKEQIISTALSLCLFYDPSFPIEAPNNTI